jgi:hypothetical protein
MGEKKKHALRWRKKKTHRQPGEVNTMVQIIIAEGNGVVPK